MPNRVAITTLNASTIDILNTIRANASYEYQQSVPEVTKASDIPRVGEILYGYPALSNQFISALMNRIAMVRVRSATFNNAYAELKKGYLEFGETVEEVFVGICKAREFSAEKAESRELKRSIPDVRTAFHAMNWRVQYPITIQDEDLRMAFTSINGVQDLIAKIVDAVYTSVEYDEFLLFKYLIIKGVTKGKVFAKAVDMADIKNTAVAFRGMSNQLTFMSNKYNASAVTTTTPKADQYIFMDAQFNAEYDVNVLASAFNMDKADFMGRLKLIDDFTSFDNERFSAIIDASDMIEPVTDGELTLMRDVKALLVDSEWFQIYDNMNKMTEKYVASGAYWNYFYNVWKTVSSSPFSNAVVFVDSGLNITQPTFYNATVTDKSVSDNAVILTVAIDDSAIGAYNHNANFVQTEECVELSIAVHKYGAIIFTDPSQSITLTIDVGGVLYESANFLAEFDVGEEITFNKKV